MTWGDPNVIDIIYTDKDKEEHAVVLCILLATEPADTLSFKKQFEVKINRYVGYILSDEFKKEYKGCKPIIKFVTKFEPSNEIKETLNLTKNLLKKYNIDFLHEIKE